MTNSKKLASASKLGRRKFVLARKPGDAVPSRQTETMILNDEKDGGVS